jgi:cytochrome c oxidase assembly protein subunit 15
MTAARYQPLVHRVALATACTALLPITVGALVTTKQYGMAFADWPTSDGQNMLLYPWLTDLVRGALDKFFEHGHRLAGVLIGCCSILLCLVAWGREERLWVRWLATAVLLSVIVQGRLGGDRVLRDDPRWALFHGTFAALVFTTMVTTAVVTSRRWFESRDRASDDAQAAPLHLSERGRTLLIVAPFVVLLQYIAGGFLRHLGMAMYEHAGGAVIVAGVAGTAAAIAIRSGSPLVVRYGKLLATSLVLQLSLGIGAWITRFGFATLGYVAVSQSPIQVAFRTAHTVVGMFVLASASMTALCAVAIRRGAFGRHSIELPDLRLPGRAAAGGSV